MSLRERMMKELNKEIKREADFIQDNRFTNEVMKVFFTINDTTKTITDAVEEINSCYKDVTQSIEDNDKENVEHIVSFIDGFEKQLIDLLKERRESLKNIGL
jgi:chorismate mutase